MLSLHYIKNSGNKLILRYNCFQNLQWNNPRSTGKWFCFFSWRQILASRWEGVRLPRTSGKSPTSPEVPRTSPEVFRRLPRKLSRCGTWQQSRGSPEVSQTSPEVPQTSPEVPGLPRRSAPFSGKPGTLSWLTKTFSDFQHKFRKLEKAVAVQNSFPGKISMLLEKIIPPIFSGSTKCYSCQGLGTFRQRKKFGRFLMGLVVDGVGVIFPFFLRHFSPFSTHFPLFLRIFPFFFAFLCFSLKDKDKITAIYCKNGEFHSDPVCTVGALENTLINVIDNLRRTIVEFKCSYSNTVF